MCLTFFPSSDTYNIKQQKREINPKKKDVIAWMVAINYLKSSGDDLLQTSFSDLGDLFFFETKRFDYIPNRIESAKNLNTGTKIWNHSSRTGQQSGRVGSYKTGSVGKQPVILFRKLPFPSHLGKYIIKMGK